MKQRGKRASLQLADLAVSIPINNAVKKEKENIRIKSLLKEYEALKQKVELLIDEKDQLQGKFYVYRSRVEDSDEILKKAEATIGLGEERLNEV